MGDKVSLCFGYTGYPLDTLYGHGDEYFDQTVKLNGEVDRGIRDIIKDFNPTLIHSHNAPDTLTLSAINVSKDIPVIHDVHEALSLHRSGFKSGDDDETYTRYCEEERLANEMSNGRIYSTDGICEYIQRRYDFDTENDLTFYDYPSASMMPHHFRDKISERDGEIHIVYVGCVTSVVESHYDLRNIFEDLSSHKMHIHIYPTTNLVTQSNDSYKKLADSNDFIHFHDTMNQKKLLEEMTQYDFGWIGLNRANNRQHLDIALPNKVMEYVSCGLPVLAFPHRTIQMFIENNGVGLVANNVGELKNLISGDLTEIKDNVLDLRQKLGIEYQISKVVNFYKQITNEDLESPQTNFS